MKKKTEKSPVIKEGVFLYQGKELKLKNDSLGFQKRNYFIIRTLNKVIKDFLGFSVIKGEGIADEDDIILAIQILVKEKKEDGSYLYLSEVFDKLTEPVNPGENIIFDYKKDSEILETLGGGILISFFLENIKEIKKLL